MYNNELVVELGVDALVVNSSKPERDFRVNFEKNQIAWLTTGTSENIIEKTT